MVYINIYEDITNALEYYNLTFDDVILIGNSFTFQYGYSKTYNINNNYYDFS